MSSCKCRGKTRLLLGMHVVSEQIRIKFAEAGILTQNRISLLSERFRETLFHLSMKYDQITV